MNKFIISTLASVMIMGSLACKEGGSLLGDSQMTLLKSTLTPVCATQLDKIENDTLDTIKKVATTEEICECAIDKTGKKVSEDLSLVTDLLQDTDKQIKFVVELGAECAADIGKKKLGEAFKDPAKTLADILKGGK